MSPQQRWAEAGERFWAKVQKSKYCWVWTGAVQSRGYGLFGFPVGRLILAHRFAFQVSGGTIPPGMVIDHLCKNTLCVNPDHLDLVTQRENVRRGNIVQVRRTHCRRGHPFTPENTITTRTQRYCRICSNASRIGRQR